MVASPPQERTWEKERDEWQNVEVLDGDEKNSTRNDEQKLRASIRSGVVAVGISQKDNKRRKPDEQSGQSRFLHSTDSERDQNAVSSL